MRNSTFLFLVLAGLGVVIGFNLETRIPVIKRGLDGSYFGYSIAEHQEKNEDGSPGSNWMLVGAPLDDNLQPNTTKSGALWKCPLTTNSRDCTQVITDGIDFDSDQLHPPRNDEIKDNQWLGVTVRSGGIGGKVMVCAHRHILKSDENRWGQGLCYILKHDLEYDEIKKPCAGKPTHNAHEQYGYCQAGTSGLLTTTENRAVIGTPGPHTWRGNLFISSVNDDFLQQDTNVYQAPTQDAPINKYSYLGMSVAAGFFFGKGLSFAAGAPRSNGTGQVILFNRHDRINYMEVALILNGEQFASSFGYEIASADINGDKVTDLIVAAPFYFSQAEGGAVYVYTKLCRVEKEKDECKPTKLIGNEESRFGFALANLGDLNGDGYEDIAVGAPYEGKGAIYVYLGSKNGILTTPSQVIHSEDMPISLRTFGYSLSGGMDMDKNGYPDLLVGAYDNDAVVLLRARKIIDITTYIRYSSENKTASQDKIGPIDPNKTGCKFDHANYTCFSFEACCKTASLVKKEDVQNLTLNYYIEAETFSGERKVSRVWFSNNSSQLNYINRIVTLNSVKHEHCQLETVYLKENTGDIQSPIKFRLNYTLIHQQPVMPTEGAPLPEIKNFPILNQQEAARVFEATFQKSCGDDEICESNLEVKAKLVNVSVSSVSSTVYELLLGENVEVVVNVNITNSGESAYESKLFIKYPTSLSYISGAVIDSGTCNQHDSPLVICSIGNPLKMNKTVNVTVRFDPKKLNDSESELEFIIFANSTSKEIHPGKPDTHLRAVVLKKAELSIKGSTRTQVAFYGGPVVGESAIKNLNEVGAKVSHIYEVSNAGPWKVSYMQVRIAWPYEVANDKSQGKWLLYLEDVPLVEAPESNGFCELPAEHPANPLNLKDKIQDVVVSNHSSIRNKRDTNKVVNARTIKDENGHLQNVVSMNCRAKTAKCFNITCTVYNLQMNRQAFITIKARFWNSTLVEDYPNVDKVVIGSDAEIIIPSNVVILQENITDDKAIAETTVHPNLPNQQEAEPVPIWIIIVAIVAGLLLLILLTLVLWKLGFFKRRRPDPTLSGNLEKHRDDNPENEALFKQ